MDSQYKAAKEAFVSNLYGSTVGEINLVSLIAPSTTFLWSTLQAKQSFFVPYTPLACLVDFLLNSVAILAAITIYGSTPILLNLLLVLPALTILLHASLPRINKSSSRSATTKSGSRRRDVREEGLPTKPFVTTWRGTMMMITCIAILAVDFKVFPRRFAKVENWGTSLMDVGVGSFVFSSGVVSARSVLKQGQNRIDSLISRRLISALRRSLPLFVLGFIRLYTVKGLDYAEHVSEYGVHWNFFFTLAFLPLMVVVCDAAFKLVRSYAALALFFGISYELLLDNTDLKAYIMTAPRVTLLSKNREGVFSFAGYLAIFLAGQAIGLNILSRTSSSTHWTRTALGKLIIWSSIWTSLYLLSTSYRFGFNLEVSRRLANLPYFLWVSAFNCCQLTMFCLIETILFPRASSGTKPNNEATSRLLRSFNRNGLAIFLLANLLTGLVNFSLATINMNDRSAMAVLLLYCTALSSVALYLDARGIDIKL